MKVRAILDYKGLAYKSVNPLAARGLLNRRGTGKVPAVEIDGAFITDSTDIAYALDERFPGQPRMDVALVLEQLEDAKQLLQSAMEQIKTQR